MYDLDIRSNFKEKIARRYATAPGVLMIEELGLAHGSIRADLVVVDNYLHGFEFKGDRDTLRRLPEQIRLYSAVMDYVTLIVGYRHAYDALRMVPPWWGVKLAAFGANNRMIFSDARSSRRNYSVDKLQLVKLLWRAEALEILEESRDDAGVRSKVRLDIYRRLCDLYSADHLRCKVRKYLSRRASRPVAEPQRLNGG